MFDINKYKEETTKNARYSRLLNKLKKNGRVTTNIEKAVEETIVNIDEGNRAFVIYGEPQSGKTEMMIALTASLLDKGSKIIILLLNDNVQLLTQNLERFRLSGLDPAPKNFNEILDTNVVIGKSEWVIFCKKNSSDLQKLLSKLENVKNKIIIDDEADYATPNSKVNKGEITRINEWVGKLIGDDGIYIGVTATPARLNLNNTFENNNEKWVDFPAHPAYTGADFFFPIEDKLNPKFKLNLLPDVGDLPKHLKTALLSFFVNVAFLNTSINEEEQNYSILIHTSGKKADHTADYQQVVKTFNILKDGQDSDFDRYIEQIWNIANDRHPGHADAITLYIRNNINRNTIVVINSEKDKNTADYKSATTPSTLFTVAIGGNIVSRGVTFDNLLSMFFTRDVKHKIQQDTYIQRARMFGSRGALLEYFELSIPRQLYLDWHRCFIFHRLSLDSIRNGFGSPVWLADVRISAVASASIDRSTVNMDSGEMSYEIFDYSPEVDALINDESILSLEKYNKLTELVGYRCLPSYLIQFINIFSPDKDKSLAIHKTSSIEGYGDADKEQIIRKKGLIGKSDREEAKYPKALHHLKIYTNTSGKARVFYRYTESIKFLVNVK